VIGWELFAPGVMRRVQGQTIVEWHRGAGLVLVSFDAGRSFASLGVARCPALAWERAEARAAILRAERAERARGGSTPARLAWRLGLRGEAAARFARGAGAARAVMPTAGPRGPAAGPGTGPEGGMRAADKPESWIDLGWDEPRAVAAAWDHLDALAPSVEGEAGGVALFGAAVAFVRGFKLLPDGAAWSLLERYNETKCSPPWRERDLRRALVHAEAHGRMGLGALFFARLARERGAGGVQGNRGARAA
jgi:hypothetical protein